MSNNYISLFIPILDKDFKEYIILIKNEVFDKKNFNFKIEEKDINIFLQLLKNYGYKILYNLNIISQAKKLYSTFKNNKINESFQKFLVNQIILIFIYLYYNSNKNPLFKNSDNNYNKALKDYKKIYSSLYTIILKYYSTINNKIIDINNISEIFRFNIILSLNDLINKNYIFNLSLIYLKKFFIEYSNYIKDINAFTMIFEQLYTNLLMEKKNLDFLKKDKSIENLAIFETINITNSNACDDKLKTLIFKTLDLIYIHNYSNILSKKLLNNIKECFYELKKNYDKNKIIKSIKSLNGQTEFIYNIFTNEENDKIDKYMPSTYFVFNDSEDSGINYNINIELFKKSFTLIFSFKIEDCKEDLFHPLISFVYESDKKDNKKDIKKDIIFNLSIKNKKLFLYLDENKINEIENISFNSSYLVIVEYNKSYLNEKIKIFINGKKKEIPCNINTKSKSSILIGYIQNDIITNNNLLKNFSNFNGIIGPIIFLNNNFDEKDFPINIFRLKGKYESILFLNSDNNLINYFYYDGYNIYYDEEFIIAQEYFMKLSKKIDEEIIFTLSPLSMLNNSDEEAYSFEENIFQKNNKNKSDNKEEFNKFYTLKKPSAKTNATYAIKNSKSISVFVEFDGIYIYTLIIEYFYNLLRMLINEQKEDKIAIANEINNVLCHIINGITKIMIFFKIDSFSNDIETFGFSLKKLFCLLIDIQPLNLKLVETLYICISKLIDHQKKVDFKTSGNFIFNFINKLFLLICSSKFFDMTNYSNSENIFHLFGLIINDNKYLINTEIMKGLLSFSFVLNPVSLDKYNNKPNGFTNKKNIEYKKMKKEYKNLIESFIKQFNSFEICIKFIQYIFKKNISIYEKYKLIKIYYEIHNVKLLYDNDIIERKEADKNTFFNRFKKEKNEKKKHIMTEEDLLSVYKKKLNKLINISSLIEQKNVKEYELLKCLFILLIYEHQVLIPFNFTNKKNNTYNKKENLNLSYNKNEIGNVNNTSPNSSLLEKLSFFSSDALEHVKELKLKNKNSSNSSLLNLSPSIIKTDKSEDIDNVNEYMLDFSSEDNNSHSFELVENIKVNTSVIKDNNILDIILNSTNYSFYIIKSIFSCLCEQWDKHYKIKFIKSLDENYETFDMCFVEFNRFKKGLLSQCIKLIECLTDENILEKSLKLIFSFMEQVINAYKTNQNNKNSKSILLHLFESKYIINNFFDFSINNEIITKEEFKEYIISSISNINNNILTYHPKPFIFSYIKNNIKNGNTKIIEIIDNLSNFIIDTLKNNKSYNSKDNICLYFNLFRLIKTLVNVFEKNPTQSQNLLLYNKFKLFYIIQNLIIEFGKNEIIYDNKIYVFNLNYLYESNKMNEKKELKILQSQETKLLSNQIIFLNIFQLALSTSFLIWTSPKNKNTKDSEKYIKDFILKFYEEYSVNEHFISYYFDLLNPFFNYHKKEYHNLLKKIPDNIKEMINKEIKCNYKFYLIGNPYVKDTRIISALLFLIVMKYQSLIISYEKITNYQNDQNEIKEINQRIENVRTLFNKLVSLAQSDILSITANINKIKDDKKFEIIIDKLESKSKSFKEYNKNYYKYLIDIIIKNKNYNLENIRNELENKFIEDDKVNKIKSVNLLKNSALNESINSSSQKNNVDKKDKTRKDSFGFYSEDLIENINNANKNINKYTNNDTNNENKIIKKKTQKEIIIQDFESANYPILCTKRDLILKKFGYFYYKDYFKDNKFIKMKKIFFYENNPKNVNNSFQGFEKLMKNNYPFTIKNFSNNSTYFPRVFYRPYTKFFDDKYFSISHNYFKKESDNKNKEEKVFHLEYGHGLLNQSNFNLFNLFYNNEDYSYILNESINSNSSNSDEEILEYSNTPIGDEEFENKLKNYESLRSNKNAKSLHCSVIGNFSPKITLKDESNYKQNIIRSNLHKKSAKQKSPLNIFNTKNNIESNINDLICYECELISPKNSSYGILCISNNFLIYQVDTKFDIKKYDKEEKYLISSSNQDLDQSDKQIIIPYNIIYQILFRKFLFFNQAFEIFLYNGKSYFFNLYKKSHRNECIKYLKEKIKNKCDIIEKPNEYFNKNKYSNLWLDGKKSTIEYLLLINKFSNRSYNVLSQYLIFPWILTDFKDIYKKENYRNLSLPMPAQTQKGLDAIKKEYEDKSNEEYKCYFPAFYSSSMYINNYLIRLYPYINNQIKCQGGQFEAPSRQFDSFQDLCDLFKEMQQETIELIPEFFFVPEMFLNLNYCSYGSVYKNNQKFLVNNLKLGEGFTSISELINFHQSTLNSENFSSQIHKWIDNIFGENQITNKKNIINSFPKECYEKYVTEEILDKIKELDTIKKQKLNEKRASSIFLSNTYQKNFSFFESDNNDNKKLNKEQIISDIKGLLARTYFIGQFPSQLFTKSHPSLSFKKADTKVYNLSNIDNLHLSLKNDFINVPNKDLLFIKECSNGNYFFILSENQILVFNKSLKQINHLSINYISKIHPPFFYDYNITNKNILKIHHIYKYLIFEILECKFFFVAGYLDNSFRIYTKDKEKDYMYSIYTESKVTCIRNIPNSSIFFTGHQNGKINKWMYSQNNKENSKKENIIIINKKDSIYGHESYVKIIEINDKFGFIVSASDDGLVFIRKIYDFELLSFIKFNKYNKEITDINLHNQIVIISVFKIKKKKIFIYSYSLNGIKLGKISEQIKMPISVKPDSDEIFVFGIYNMYLVKISMRERTSLISLTNDYKSGNFDQDNDDSDDEENSNNKFNEDLSKSVPISYFYDKKYHVLFCLFINGQLHRVNLIKNV